MNYQEQQHEQQLEIIEQTGEQADKIFNCLEMLEPRDGLYDDIIRAIEKKKLFSWYRNLISFGVLIAGFFSFLILTWNTIVAQLFEMETVRLISLFFSDSGAVLANWKYFALYLLESLPVAFLLTVFIAAFLILLTFKLAIQELHRRTILINHKKLI